MRRRQIYMAYELRWGNRSWIYGLGMGLLIGMGILLFMYNMKGTQFFFNYYSPMLGYYVLLSICQSHYFKRPPEPDMKGLFRQFVSIFGAVVLFFVNEMIMINLLGVPTPAHPLLYNGDLVMSGHFTFIVFGFFIYGFDDFMFKGKLVKWIKHDWLKAVFWYFVIWALWLPLYYMKGGLVQAYSETAFDALALNKMLGISQWAIIMSLMIALTFKDYIATIKIENDYLKGLMLLAGSFIVGGAIAYFCFGLTEYIAPWDHLDSASKWHHVLYMGTYPLTPVILLGLYTKNFSHIEDPLKRVGARLMFLVPLVILSYFIFHLVIAQPEWLLNKLFPGSFSEGMGVFGDRKWYAHLDLYFNFTVSIIPLTHHWFCGRFGFMKEAEEAPSGRKPIVFAQRRSFSREGEAGAPPVKRAPPRRMEGNYGYRERKEWR